MSSNNHITYFSTYDSHPLSTRASSATLFIPQCPFDLDGAIEKVDMTIAQELLDKDALRIPKRRMSFNQSMATKERDGKDESNGLEENTKRQKRRSRYNATSNTWTSSEGGESNYGENDDRSPFVREYNRLAKKYGVAAIILDEYVSINLDKVTIFAKQGSWIMRKLLRRTNSIHMANRKSEKLSLRHKRSVSDLTLRLKPKKDPLKDKSLEELVRLCGASALYLPSEYAAGTLAVPTCFRATAQYLIQHAASTRGIFRIPGAHSTVMALYNHYATEDEHGDVISGTVRCPTLPEHIKCDVHDVASAFKRFLAGLPGGILGRAWLFEAFVSIHNHLDAAPEWTRTKQSRLRARLIALAIASTVTRYQRELICAVFGLLSMIGRTAETALREDEHGRPLPTSDLMGYESLGIVFGPLLIGEMLDAHDLRPQGTDGAFHLAKKNSPRSLRGRGKNGSKSAGEASTLMRESTEKIRMANKITEMLITHWRDIVRHMKNLGALRSTREFHTLATKPSKPFLRPSASESFMIRKPPQWDLESCSIRRGDHSVSPSPAPRNFQDPSPKDPQDWQVSAEENMLSVKKQRSKTRPMSSQRLSGARSLSILAPTVEENQSDEEQEKTAPGSVRDNFSSNQRLTQPSSTGESQIIPPYQLERSGFAREAEHAARETGRTDLCTTFAGSSNLAVPLQNPKAAPMMKSSVAAGRAAQYSPVLLTGGQNSFNGDYAIAHSKEHTVKPLSLEESTRRIHTPRLMRNVEAKLDTQGTMHLPVQPNLSITEFPRGLVSYRVRGFAASDPGRPPSGFHALLESPNGSPEWSRRKQNLGAHTSNVFSRSIKKDPLSSVSHEDDMASLAALAEVLDSQEDQALLVKPKQPTLTVGESHFNIGESQLVSKGDSTHIKSSSECQDEGCSKKRVSKIGDTYVSAMQPFEPITPRRTIIATQSAGSVKALAAKFNNVEMDALATQSPNKAADRRQGTHSEFEKNIVSRYTSNVPSPARSYQRSTRSGSAKSERSLQFVRTPRSTNRLSDAALTAMLPEPTGSTEESTFNLNTDGARDATSPRYPRFRYITPHEKDDTEATVRWRGKDTHAMTVSNPLQKYSEIATVKKRSSLGKILPRPGEPKVDQYMNFTRPSSVTTCLSQNHSALSFDPSDTGNPLSSGGAQGSSVLSIRRGTSLLFSQVQRLQQQLRVKNNEVEHLKFQLATKINFNEIGTLSEELRRTKRNLNSWKKRAEIAERRLVMLSVLDRKDDAQEGNTEESSTTCICQDKRDELNLTSTENMAEKPFCVEIKTSNETIRRLRPYSATFSESSSTKFDDLRDMLRAYQDGVYELE